MRAVGYLLSTDEVVCAFTDLHVAPETIHPSLVEMEMANKTFVLLLAFGGNIYWYMNDAQAYYRRLLVCGCAWPRKVLPCTLIMRYLLPKRIRYLPCNNK